MEAASSPVRVSYTKTAASEYDTTNTSPDAESGVMQVGEAELFEREIEWMSV
jgi:hypothetical protein